MVLCLLKHLEFPSAANVAIEINASYAKGVDELQETAGWIRTWLQTHKHTRMKFFLASDKIRICVLEGHSQPGEPAEKCTLDFAILYNPTAVRQFLRVEDITQAVLGFLDSTSLTEAFFTTMFLEENEGTIMGFYAKLLDTMTSLRSVTLASEGCVIPLITPLGTIHGLRSLTLLRVHNMADEVVDAIRRVSALCKLDSLKIVSCSGVDLTRFIDCAVEREELVPDW